MKVKIIVILLFLLFPSLALAAQYKLDNAYGAYLISKVKKNISMEFEGVEWVDVLKILSQQSGLNFISSQSVEDRVITLYLEQVPLQEAMDILFEANGLRYDFYPDAKIFVVKESGGSSVDLKTKIYFLKHVRLASTNLQKKIGDSISDSGEGESSGGSSGGTGLKSVVQGMLSDFGKLYEDPNTNSLIVVDLPSRFPAIDKIIQKLDIPQPKVMIEVEMLDVSKRKTDKMGIQWPEDILALDVPGTRITSFPYSGKFKPKTGEFSWAGLTSPGGVDMSGVSANDFAPSVLTVVGAKLVYNFLKTHADAKSIARPKILTLSNETAEIRITTSEAVGIKKSESKEGALEYSVERTETGTILNVTPQINVHTKEITLLVDAQQKEATDSGFVATTGAFIEGNIKDPEERSTKTVVRLQDGEVLLLGGLIRKTETDNGTSFPYISNIPFLGNLFKNRTGGEEERELFIFLTPRIVEDSAMAASPQRLENREQSFASRRGKIQDILDVYSHHTRQSKQGKK